MPESNFLELGELIGYETFYLSKYKKLIFKFENRL